jgi:hypothetical protein
MSSPKYNNTPHDEMYENSAFAADMSNRMQVPKRIRIGGNIRIKTIEFLACLFLNLMFAGGENSNSPEYNSSRYASKMEVKYEMKVPDRILLVGIKILST